MCEKVYKNKILMCEKVYKNKILTCEKVYKNKILMSGKSLQLTNVSSKGPKAPYEKFLRPKAPTRPLQGPYKAPQTTKAPGP